MLSLSPIKIQYKQPAKPVCLICELGKLHNDAFDINYRFEGIMRK